MKNHKILTIALLIIVLFTHEVSAGWVISSGTKVRVSSGSYVKTEGNLSILANGKITNDGVLGLKGNFSNEGEATLGSGVFNFTGTNAQLLTGNFVLMDMMVHSGSSVEILPGTQVTVNGTAASLNGTSGIIVRSDQTGSGSLIHNTSNLQGSVEEFLTSEKWHYISAPISDAVIGSYLDIYLIDWDEPSAGWSYLVEPLALPLNAGTGYGVWASDQYTGNTTINFAGSLIAEDIVLNLDYSPASTQTGWNLIGNPFSSAVDWNANWTMNNVGGWAVIYDNGTDRGWNPYLPAGSQSYNNKSDGIIPLTQGFWVRATGAGATLTLPASERIHSNQPFYKEASEAEVPTLRLSVEGNNSNSEAVVILLPEATDGFDELYDLGKFNDSEGAPALYSLMGENEFVVNVLSSGFSSSSDPKINMGFEMDVAGQCKISAGGLESFSSETPVYLEDMLENNFIDLRLQPEYTFVTNPLDEVQRFVLHFSNPVGVTENPLTNRINIYGGKGYIYISMDEPVTGTARIYDMLGREAGNIRLDGSTKFYSIPSKGETYYVVRIIGNEEIRNKKVYVY